MNKEEIKKGLIKFLEWMDCDESDYELSNIEIIDKYLKTIEESEEKCNCCKTNPIYEKTGYGYLCRECYDFVTDIL